MKKHCTRNYRGLLAATLASVLTMPAWAAPAPETDPVKEEVKAVLNQHDEAMGKQDLKALLSLVRRRSHHRDDGDRPRRVLEGQNGG
ncbi:MAG: hypothetical protein V9H25_06765 [Candidatus Competibacter sp.]